MSQNQKLLLLIQSHRQAALLPAIVPLLRGVYSDLFIVYSPVILVDEAKVSKDLDAMIADMQRAMKDAYNREDGAGGDSYKAKRDAAVLDKAAKIKGAWKTMTPEEISAAEQAIFGAFFEARPCESIAITQHVEPFETAAYVEFINASKGGLPPNFQAGTFFIGWPSAFGVELPKVDTKPFQAKVTAVSATVPAEPPKPTAAKDKRFAELCRIPTDELGPLAFRLGLNPNGMKRMTLVHAIHKAEKAKALAAV